MSGITLRMALLLEERLDIFALAQDCAAGTVSHGGMAAFLLEILSPLAALGAIACDARGKRSIDIDTLRRFFIGVLGFSPRALFEDATLADLAAAYEGYSALHRQPHSTLPAAATLNDLTHKFPDFPVSNLPVKDTTA